MLSSVCDIGAMSEAQTDERWVRTLCVEMNASPEGSAGVLLVEVLVVVLVRPVSQPHGKNACYPFAWMVPETRHAVVRVTTSTRPDFNYRFAVMKD